MSKSAKKPTVKKPKKPKKDYKRIHLHPEDVDKLEYLDVYYEQ